MKLNQHSSQKTQWIRGVKEKRELREKRFRRFVIIIVILFVLALIGKALLKSDKRISLQMDNLKQEQKDKDLSDVGGIDLNQLNMSISGMVTRMDLNAGLGAHGAGLLGNDVGIDRAMMNQSILFLTPKILNIGNIQLGVFLGLNQEHEKNDSEASKHQADFRGISVLAYNRSRDAVI